LGIVFISSAYASDYPRLMPLLLEKLALPVVIGCGGGGVVGMKNEREAIEVEGKPALSLSVAHLPEVEITPFQILGEQLPDLDSSPEAWWDLIGLSMAKQPHFILLADPFSSKINELIQGLDFAYPGSVKVGGLASASIMGFASGLFYYSSTQPEQLFYYQGTVGVALSGNITVEAIVAQGCRPIGTTYQITQGERNVILELADRNGKTGAPLNLLRDLISSLSEAEQKLAQNSLFIGVARDEFKLELQGGDFLIRNLVGVDPKYGAIAIGDRVRSGQRIQFHLRDARTSAEDLEMLLSGYRTKTQNAPVAGALMFSCLGRGESLYNKPNFDSQLFRSYFNDTPLGGFFCNGEIGPVGGSTFLHGYTSAFAIFR
jgi:small ligand-binding sensory domain FIST